MSVGVIPGPYLSDVLAQHEALTSLCEKLSKASFPESLLENIRQGQYRRLVLTGMGSSLFATYPTFRRMSETSVCTHQIETAELLTGFDSLYASDTLLVAVSQSGESAEIVQLLQRASEFGHIIGVTNNSESNLATRCNTVIDLAAGTESTVSCKTYLCTLAALHWMRTQLLGGSPLDAIQDILSAERAVAGYLSQWQDHVAAWMPLIDGVQNVFVTGRGDSLATALTGGLILKESTRQHAEGMSCAAFRHGPMEMADESVLVVIFEGSGSEASLNRRLAEDIRRGGGKAMLVGSSGNAVGSFAIPKVDSCVRPIMEFLPMTMLSLAIASREGIEAGRFQRASKITVVA